jgi:excisionase family DNA binding protein
MSAGPVQVHLPPEAVEAIAQRAAELVLAQLPPPAPAATYLNVEEAAYVLRSNRQRVYDLLSSGRLHRVKDGTRVLVARAELDAYLHGQ